jgi:hypothetical protein
MAKATAKDPTIESETLRAQAESSPLAANLMLAFHRQWKLWRICRRKDCKRARRCYGNELSCAARRWRIVHATLEKLARRSLPDRVAQRRLRYNVRLWSEVKDVLCQHEEHLFLNMPKGPFLRVFRNNPDGSKSVMFHRDLTDEQARKLQREYKRWHRD